MSEKRLSGSINLTKFKSVILEKKGKTGMVRGVFIPIEANMLEEKDGNVYCPLNVIVRDEQDKYGQNGFIAKTVPAEIYKATEDKESLKDVSPILGNIKDWSGGGSVVPAAVVDEDDDLPF